MIVGVAQEFDEGVEIGILMKDSAAAVTAIKDMVTVAAQGDPQRTRHRSHYGP